MNAVRNLECKTAKSSAHRIGLIKSVALSAVCGILFGLTAAPPAEALVYTVVDLGTLPGGSWSKAYALNLSNQVTGEAPNASNNSHAFFYSNGMQDLGTLNGFTYSTGYGINDFGQVVGFEQNLAGTWRAFLYSGGIMHGLGTLGGTNSYAAAINNAGQIAGWSDTQTSRRAFLYSGGVMHNLGNLLGGDLSEAYGINNIGQIVGHAETSNGDDHAFVWSSGQGAFDLGIFAGGTYSNAQGINDFGAVVGLADIAGGNVRACLWSNGTIHNLGTLPNFVHSGAYGINKYGRVAGYAFNPNLTSRAFIWDNVYGLRDLNNHIPANSGWTLRQVYDINANGVIVGWGVHSGQVHGFLLKPSLVFSTVDLSKYVAYDPFWYLKDPGGPVEKAHIVNTSQVTLTGPFQVMVTGLPRGRTVVNANGAYEGTPYVTLYVRSLAPGASVDVALKFNPGSDGQIPAHSAHVYSGTL